MSVRIFYDNAGYRLKNSRKTIEFIKEVIKREHKIPGDLCFIMTVDEKLVKINREFLKRNTYTDVIAFDYSQEEIVNGEIYISQETVSRNANNYKVSLEDETRRVMIHGTLHLCGYKDESRQEKEEMRRLEDKWLKYWEKHKNDFQL